VGAGDELTGGRDDLRGDPLRMRPHLACGRFAVTTAVVAIVAALLFGARAAAAEAQEDSRGLPVRLHTEEALQGIGERLVRDSLAWRPFPGIGRLADVAPDTLDLWIVRSLASGPPEGLRTPEPWVAGVAQPGKSRVALRVGEGMEGLAGLPVVFRHELAHLALHAATGGNHPAWLTEGYAQYASGGWSWDEAWQLRLVFFRGGGATLRDLDLRFRRQELDARLGYLLSYTVVHELAAMGGEPGLRALFTRLRERDSLDQALRRVYGVTEEQLERRWKRTVLDRYGWLYMISRAAVFWVGVSVLVLVVTVRRARQDRKRLEALRRADEAEERGVEEVD
jgi:predicted SprT family Zn-dependent metalloprotease